MAEPRRRRRRPVGPPAVSIRNLRKEFGAKVAVDDLSLDVPTGSFFGLVGPNGAGKSTTLKATTGLLRPTRGTVVVDGVDVWSDPPAAKARMGILPEDPKLFDRLTGGELLTYNGLLRGMRPEVVEARAVELLEVLGLADATRTMVVDYSQGMRKKAALACALIHAPRVLFLDEPFESVDPVSARTIRMVLQRFTDEGGTVVFSSHVMDTVERLCDHVAILHHGRVVASGATAAVRGGRALEDVFIEAVGAVDAPGVALSWLGTSSD
ncbi:MAG TPA: ABC transporter ATP-binding protein [Acidimicrobiales bacterium]|nr:ABC transporter ATP-binding protein [Acidimicrobiales bacterium]